MKTHFNGKRPRGPIWIAILTVFLVTLACGIGVDSLPTAEQVQSGAATAQALGQQASAMATELAPTLQAAGEQASAFATNAAPTLVALQTQAVNFATQSAPTLEAGVSQLATAAAGAQGTGEQVQATLQAAGLDADYLRDRVAGLMPDENGNINFNITEAEINFVLQARSLTAEPGAEPIPGENSRIEFEPEQVIVTSNIQQPVTGRLRMVLRPYVLDGRVQFEVLAADLDGQQVPAFLLTSIESSLNGTLNGALSMLPGSIEVQAVYVNEGIMTIVTGRAATPTP